jgi:NitT/TauT family transport system permease protein
MNPRYRLLRQVTAFLILVAGWEALGRAGLLNPMYAPSPSGIAAVL